MAPGAPLTSGYGGGAIGAVPPGAEAGLRSRLTDLIMRQRTNGGQSTGFGGPPGLGGPGAAQGPAPIPNGPTTPGVPGPMGGAMPPAMLGGPRPPMMAGMQPGLQPGMGGARPGRHATDAGRGMPGRGPYG